LPAALRVFLPFSAMRPAFGLSRIVEGLEAAALNYLVDMTSVVLLVRFMLVQALS